MVEKKHSFSKTEIKAGITVLASLLVFCLFVAAITGMRSPEEIKVYHSDFSAIDGLNVGADVRFGGIKVGRVITIQPSEDDKSLVRIKWSVPVDIPVNKDCVAFVGQVSIASEKHLEITTGSKNAGELEKNSLVPKKSGSPGMFGAFEDMACTVDRVLAEDGLLGDIRKILGVKDVEADDPSKLVSVTKLISGIDKAMSESSGLVNELHSMVKVKGQNLDEIFEKLKQLEDSGVDLLTQVREILGENRSGLKGTIDNIQLVTQKGDKLADTLLEEVEKASANLHTLLMNSNMVIEKNSPAIEGIVDDLERITSHLKRFSQILSDKPEALLQGRDPGGR